MGTLINWLCRYHLRSFTYLRTVSARETAAGVTWDQVINWLVVPGMVALIVGVGGVWPSRYIP
jgi:hypothetical protein